MTTAAPAPTAQSSGLLPVAIKTLAGKEMYNFDLYLWPSKAKPPILYREKNVPLGPNEIQRLLGQGIDTLYMRLGEAEVYRDHVQKYVINDESMPAADRYQLLKDATKTVLSTAMSKGDIGAAVSVSADLSRDLVSIICDKQNVLNDLLSVMTHDYTTFTHITNVCTCSIVLAEAYGIRDQAQLTEIAQGALLHDIGKCYVPAAILNKTSALSEEEQEIVRKHPTDGFNDLCLRPGVTWGQLMMVYQHHERAHGGGYPCGLTNQETHEWARLCAIADVYDALTRDRPYRRGADTKDVIEYLDRESGRSFDEEFCQCWISTLKKCRPSTSSTG